jgi:predicted enzyme related to lactoylglutathione lyase
MANEICYLEIVTKELPRSIQFYEGVFGWKVTPAGDNYAMFTTGSGPEGGFTPPMPGLAHGVCIYINVENIAEALERIVAAGGEVVLAKTKISEEYGYYGLFKDPQGNVIGLWSQV